MLLILKISNICLMENIIEPNSNFDFSKLSLAQPTGIQGGAYFTKILYNSKPIYIQTNESLSKQGFIKNGKKYYIDLMFDNNSSELINWFENLEEKCQQLIYEKSDSWFQNKLEMNDIETAFNSIIRVYKSGKYYLVRCNSKSLINGDPHVKIYNENENNVSYTDLNNSTKFISILEIQGIKFTTRNFSIEIEIKQIMTLNPEPLFDNYLIKQIKKNQETKEYGLNLQNKINLPHNESTQNIIKDENNVISDNNSNNLIEKINLIPIDLIDNNKISLEETSYITSNKSLSTNISNEYTYENNNQENNLSSSNNLDKNINNINLEIEDLNSSNLELKEVDISLEDNTETLELKKPNQVYFEIYKQAIQKAKEAKKAAIIAYLEAKNIKKTYMIEHIDEDIDDDIENVSESELDNFL